MKEQAKNIATEWLISFITFNIINIFINILFNKIADWELFSYHLFGSFIGYAICFVLQFWIYRLFPVLVKPVFSNLFVLLLCLEVSYFLLFRTSLTYIIIRFAWSDKNYMMFFYPLCLIAIRAVSIIKKSKILRQN